MIWALFFCKYIIGQEPWFIMSISTLWSLPQLLHYGLRSVEILLLCWMNITTLISPLSGSSPGPAVFSLPASAWVSVTLRLLVMCGIGDTTATFRGLSGLVSPATRNIVSISHIYGDILSRSHAHGRDLKANIRETIMMSRLIKCLLYFNTIPPSM